MRGASFRTNTGRGSDSPAPRGRPPAGATAPLARAATPSGVPPGLDTRRSPYVCKNLQEVVTFFQVGFCLFQPARTSPSCRFGKQPGRWAGGSPPGRGATRACAAVGTATRPTSECPRIGPQCRVSAEGSRAGTTDSDRARGGAEQGVPPALATGSCRQLRFRVPLRRRARIDTGLGRTRLGSVS